MGIECSPGAAHNSPLGKGEDSFSGSFNQKGLGTTGGTRGKVSVGKYPFHPEGTDEAMILVSV